jgi:hypothetical protein
MLRPSQTILSFFALAALLSVLAAWENMAGGVSGSSLSDVVYPDMREAKQKERRLLADLASEQGRRRQMDDVVLAAVAGRTSLLEGAGRLRELYRGEPESVWERVCARFPDISDDERYCRLLIAEVESFERGPTSARRPSVALRMEAELQDHLRRGPFRLPEAGQRGGGGVVAVPMSSAKGNRVNGQAMRPPSDG